MEGEGASFYRNGQVKSITPFYKGRVTGPVCLPTLYLNKK
jgi:antitoxin component YwqK of YwqJK toxin-antitoxin module